MKKGLYGNLHYTEGDTIENAGRKYIFCKIVPNHSIDCDLYHPKDKGSSYSFCDNCGGCSTSQPEGCIRGIFKLVKND